MSDTTTDHIFEVFLLPNGFSSDGRRLRFSLVLEINTNHPVFPPAAKKLQPDRSAVSYSEWYKAVHKLPEVVRHYFGQADATRASSTPISKVTLALTPAAGSPAADIQVLGIYQSPNGIPGRPDSGADTLYHHFIPRLPETKLSPLAWSSFEPPRSWSVAVGTRLDTVGSKPDIAITASGNTLTALLTNCLQELTGGLKQLPGEVQDGIAAAADNVAVHNRVRLAALLPASSLKLAGAASLSDRVRAVNDNQKALADVMRPEPTTVVAAYDVLSSSLPLRRWVGTIIDLETELKDIPTRGAYHLSLTFTDDVPDYPAPYFLARPTKLNFTPPVELATGETGLWVSVQEDSLNAKDGIVRLNKISRILQNEPEGQLRNAADAMATAAGSPVATLTPRTLLPSSYRAGSELLGAEALQEQRKDQQIQGVLRQALNHATNLRTKGHVLYLLNDPYPERQNPENIPPALEAGDLIHGYAIYGRYVPAQKGDAPWRSLTTITEELHSSPDPEQQQQAPPSGENHFRHRGPAAIAYGNGVTVQEGTDPNALKSRHDGYLFTFDGTSLVTRHPMRHLDKPVMSPVPSEALHAEAAIIHQARLLELSRAEAEEDGLYTTQPELQAVRYQTACKFGIDDFPFNTRGPLPAFLLRRQAHADEPSGDESTSELKLRFSRHKGNGPVTEGYQYLALAQYRNGYVPAASWLETRKPSAGLLQFASAITPFYRQEHLGDAVVCLSRPIYKDRKPQAAGRAEAPREIRDGHWGETTHHLVVRTAENLQTTDECSRYLLPPVTPGLTTLPWSREDWRERLGREGYGWFRRMQCEVRSEKEFERNRKVCEARRELGNADLPVQGCAADCRHYCGGAPQPPEVFSSGVHYLPDPEVTGLQLEFFLDEAHELPADFTEYPSITCGFDYDSYPQLKPWEFVLWRDHDPDSPGRRVEQRGHRLIVRLRQGARLFVRVLATYDAGRSPFDPSLMKAVALFTDKQLMAGKRPEKLTAVDSTPNKPKPEHTADPLHANIVRLTLTHASQKPLFKPVIQHISLRRTNPLVSPAPATTGNLQPGPQQTGAFTVITHLHYEHLNTHQGIEQQNVAPTGELELFGIWNDFTDDRYSPATSLKEKRKAGKWVRVSTITSSGEREKQARQLAACKSGRDFQRIFWEQLLYESDPAIQLTYHTDMSFRVRNISKFRHYFVAASNAASDADARDNSARTGQQAAGEKLTEVEKELFGLWSDEYQLSDYPTRGTAPDAFSYESSYLPNNVKPASPRVYRIVPLRVRDDAPHGMTTRTSGSRVRFYLQKPQMMAPGQDTRIAVLVHTIDCAYPSYLHPWLPQGGNDVVTDISHPLARVATPPITTVEAPADSLLNATHFGRTGPEVEPDYLTRFAPYFDGDQPDLPDAARMGIISYHPQFDQDKQLWYVDLHLNLHNRAGTKPHQAFVRLALLSHQPSSANYNEALTFAPGQNDNAERYQHDMRVSVPTTVDFFSVLPERRFANPYLLFRNATDKTFSLACELSTLFIREPVAGAANTWVVATQFVIAAEQRVAEDVWELIPSHLTSYGLLFDGIQYTDKPPFPAKTGSVQATIFHHLLPPRLPSSVPGLSLRTDMACQVGLDIDRGGNNYWFGHPDVRVVIYEVEWHDTATDLTTFHDRLTAGSDRKLYPHQIAGVGPCIATVFAP